MVVEEVREDRKRPQKPVVQKDTKNFDSITMQTQKLSESEEITTKPINGQVFPPYLPQADRPGRNTNQLK